MTDVQSALAEMARCQRQTGYNLAITDIADGIREQVNTVGRVDARFMLDLIKKLSSESANRAARRV